MSEKAGMNRQRAVIRTEEEGSQRAQQLGLALAALCDEEFLEALIHHKSALDDFGGDLYIGANRVKYDAEGRRMEKGDTGPGTFVTTGYIFHYGSKSRVKQLATEEEVAEVPEPPQAEEEEPSPNGAEPEPVEA